MENQLRWTLITALFLSAASLSTCASVDLAKIHEHMTEDELSATFNVKDRAAVPNYEVVPIVYQPNQAHRQRRSVQPGHHVVSIKDLKLYLEPVEHVLVGEDTPVYLASFNAAHPSAIRYERIENAWPKGLRMYQDRNNYAALVMFKESDGKINIEGLIGDDTVVKPVPSRFKNSTSLMNHIVYTKESFNKSLSSSSYFDNSYWSKKPRSFEKTQKPSKVDVVYPETLVIADHSTYLAHGENLQALCLYMAVFWNAVDLRFRSLKNPKVRLNIAGLIVAKDPQGASYIELQLKQENYLDSSETLYRTGLYLYGEKRFSKDTYDITVVMTNLDLCSTENENGTDTVCDPKTRGIAQRGGACMHGGKRFDAGVAVTEDHAKFDGILTVAHEIGHLLGADDDYEFVDEWQQCHLNFGYLMAPDNAASANAMLWSDCSRIVMSHFLRTNAKCLHNKPIVKKPFAKVLPGQMMSKDGQCNFWQDDMVACGDEREDECRILYCQKSKSWLSWLTFWTKSECVSAEHMPLEGSSCSGGGTCLEGVCIHME